MNDDEKVNGNVEEPVGPEFPLEKFGKRSFLFLHRGKDRDSKDG